MSTFRTQLADAHRPGRFPSLPRQAANLAGAVGRAAGALAAGLPVKVERPVYEARRAVCRACDDRDPERDRCRRCGCFLKAKLRLATESCPAGKWPASPSSPNASIGIAMPARNEGADVRATIASYLEAGADRIAVVDDASTDDSMTGLPAATLVARNRHAAGPAFCRNLAAAMLGTDVIVFSDAHVRVISGDLRAFAAVAVARRAIVQAAVQPLDGDRNWTGYGGRFVQNADGILDVTINQRHPGREIAPTSAAWGSVYAIPATVFRAMGGWPRTISHGYNEQALTLVAHFCAVPILVDTRFVVAHRFKKRFNYPVRRRNQHINRFIVHHCTASPVWWEDYWRPRLTAACPGAVPAAEAVLADPSREADRRRFAALKVATDAEVLDRLEVGGFRASRRVDGC